MSKFSFFKTYKEYNQSNVDIDHKFFGYIDSLNFVFSNSDKEDMGMDEHDLRILSEYYNKKYTANCQDSGKCIVTIIGICRDDYDWYLVAKKEDASLDVIFAYDADNMKLVKNQ